MNSSLTFLPRSAAAFLATIALSVTTVMPAIATPGQPGTLDASWATLSPQGAGKLLTSFGNSNDVARTLLLQPDGKVIQVGLCNASTNGSVLSVCISRFLPSGALDPSFNGTGQVAAAYAGGTGLKWSVLRFVATAS
jgi:hypothetical protein